MKLKHLVLFGMSAALSQSVFATCMQNNYTGNLKVWFPENIRVEGNQIRLDNILFQKTLSPAEEICFPDNHPDHKNGDWFVFEVIKPLTDVDRTQAPTVYYLSQELPDHASVSVEYTGIAVEWGLAPKVTVMLNGAVIYNGQLLNAILAD